MNIGEFAIVKKTITMVLMVIGCVGGLIAYDKLGRLEDPEFTIKEAMLITPYPGASPEEVEKEVTSEIEKAVQELGQLKRVESWSFRGQSIVKVVIKDKYDKTSLPQVWDEMRRKVHGAQNKLPPGAGPTNIDDDFGDVYGVYVGISGDGYSYRELKNYADFLRRELLLVQDVKRVTLWGARPEAVYVEMDRSRMARLGITQAQIFDTLQSKNLAVDGGKVAVGSQFLTINPTGQFTSEQQFRDLLISKPGDPKLIYLGDVADIKREVVDPATTKLRMSYKQVYKDGALVDENQLEMLESEDEGLETIEIRGQHAIGLAISTVLGGNVVNMGEALAERIDQLEDMRPIGMEVEVISLQSESVVIAINSFINNLFEAIVIVVVVLLVFMGLKSGVLIGFILFLTIVASFIVMQAQGILLERISLGALIIALGMLVDNAIVVVETMKLRIERGDDKMTVAREVVAQNQWPLFGATWVAVLAFGAIGLSTHSTGEFCRSLFQVLMISLLMSWITAVTATPLLCVMLFKPSAKGGEGKDPYAGKLFVGYRAFLDACIRKRYLTIAVAVALFIGAMMAFNLLPSGFFPASARPQYMVDVWLPGGRHIDEMERNVKLVEEKLMTLENTKSIASHLGSGAARFLVTYSPETPDTSYAQLLVSVYDHQSIVENIAEMHAWAKENLPDAIFYCKRFTLGPGSGGKVQLRIAGPDFDVLHDLSDEMAAIMHENPNTLYVRSDWSDPVQVIQPVLSEAQARRQGIDRPAIARRLAAAYTGYQVGVYREGTLDNEDRILPIISRPPPAERGDINSLNDLQVYSPAADGMIPMRQVVSEFDTVWEERIIRRRNRLPTLTLHSDPVEGEPSVLRDEIAPFIEARYAELAAEMGLGSDYKLEWGGEYEDSNESIAALGAGLPLFLLLMVFIVIALFNNLRQPLIIWLTVPLAMIGVTVGLLLFNQPFSFMAMLGTLSLSGMLIKNSIVLMDEINSNNARELSPYEAVVMAGVSRLRPVAMAAMTTVMGMIPLVPDVFFVSLAVAVMFGLTFATVLTLVMVPTLYATIYRIPSPKK